MKNYIYITLFFLIIFNNICAIHDLEMVPLPDHVSSALSKIPVIVTCKIESRSEKILGFLFGKYLFIPNPVYANNKIKSIEQIQKFDFDDNKLILQTFPAHSFEFGTETTDEFDLYATLIKKAPFILIEHPNYAKYFKSLLSKDDFIASLKDKTSEYYFIYFEPYTNKILWEKYSSINVESYIIPFRHKNNTVRVFYSLTNPFFGDESQPKTIMLKLPGGPAFRGILVLCKPDNQCYITKFSPNTDLDLIVYFVNNDMNHYKELLIDERLKVD